MKKSLVSGDHGAPRAAPLLRPSSVRRLGNLRALVSEFSGRDIGSSGVALLLGCSLSAARNYVAELLDAGVVAPSPVKQKAGCVDRTLYRLNADPLAVHQFLAALARSHDVDGMPALRGAVERQAPPDPIHVHRQWRDAGLCFAANNAPARRDPLVAALFGAAGMS